MTPYPRALWWALWGSGPCRPGQSSQSCRWQPGPQSGVSLAEAVPGTKRAEQFEKHLWREPCLRRRRQEVSPGPGKSLMLPVGWGSAPRTHLCHAQLQSIRTDLYLVQYDLHQKLLQSPITGYRTLSPTFCRMGNQKGQEVTCLRPVAKLSHE